MDISINIKVPGSWNELSDKQLKNIGKIYHKKGEVFDLAVWLILNNVQSHEFVKLQKLKTIMNLVTISDLKKHYEFIYSETNRDIFIEIKPGFIKPMPRLFNITIEQFAIADDLNNRYLETGDINYLRHLAASLYLRKKEVFDALLQNERAKRFNKVPGHILLALHICYNGCKNHIVSKYPKVFPKVTKSQKKSAKGFLDVVLQMSGQKFGTHEETKKTRLHTFMAEFENSIINQEKWKEKQPIRK